MTDRTRRSEHNITGSGIIITGGTIINSPVTSTSGARSPVTVGIPASAGPWPGLLAEELARIRQLLEQDDDPGRAIDRGDALGAVAALQADVPGTQGGMSGGQDGAREPGNLRRRVKELIGVLAPVAEVIGGVAALQEIVTHL